MIVAIKNLSKQYKKQQVLRDISLSIDSPGIWALVGPNGVGKTTFLNIVTNLIPATSGSVELVGKSNKNYKVFKEVSYLQDNTVLFDYLTGYDHLKYVCDMHRLPAKRIREVASYVGMENYLRKTVGNYSLGMKQHLLLAMAIINEPKLLLLDEPLNGLDPTSAIMMRRILLELADKGTTIILSSHNLSEVDRVTKQIIFLKDGKLIEENMDQYEQVYYQVTVKKKSPLKELLTEKAFVFDETGSGFRILLGSHEFQSLLDLLQQSDVDVLDMQKEITGSEKRYEEVFEVGSL
ncbi:ABC transporter ATP-binding protein [Sporosarcina sp. NCCP-2222]|uniref:ABC transporter ATP-binding protein n=1 Tax=Sporosarcina sp. NCCP-2222 TaxID=2935073 RepID=UPI00207DAD48|nr:ABC transporter ATP-binding protein [Sporosarcina sp. NCCP-2222]GKV55286.1 ABC transporter ATP-binding protein [Sporosarcina sp. NCCP-2222]